MTTIVAVFFCMSAFAKDIDFNPVKHDPRKPPATKNESVPELKPIVTLCDIGDQHYLVNDQLDESRCSERGGKLRGAIADGHAYTDIKQAVPPIKANYYNRPLQPPSDRTRTNRHYNPLDNSATGQ